jgi:predicted phosphate transport protein (TIGR00153 family)
MIRKFIPREFNFFDLFERQVSFAVDATLYFKQVISSGNINEGVLQKIRDLEHQGDDVAHTIIDQLNKTFITPFDREDIYALTKELDNVVDMINTILGRMVIYKLSGVNPNLVKFAVMIDDSVNALALAIKGMRSTKNSKSVIEACVEINRLENEGDAMRDMVLAELFEKEKDTITIIKLKEIYQDAETLLDICEDVAHVVESILVKQA